MPVSRAASGNPALFLAGPGVIARRGRVIYIYINISVYKRRVAEPSEKRVLFLLVGAGTRGEGGESCGSRVSCLGPARGASGEKSSLRPARAPRGPATGERRARVKKRRVMNKSRPRWAPTPRHKASGRVIAFGSPRVILLMCPPSCPARQRCAFIIRQSDISLSDAFFINLTLRSPITRT